MIRDVDMKWRTVIEVAKIFPNSATVTQAECTAAVRQQEPFAAWLEQDAFALFLIGI